MLDDAFTSVVPIRFMLACIWSAPSDATKRVRMRASSNERHMGGRGSKRLRVSLARREPSPW